MFDKRTLRTGCIVMCGCVACALAGERLQYAPQPATAHIASFVTGGSSLTVTGAGFNTTTFAPLAAPPHWRPLDAYDDTSSG